MKNIIQAHIYKGEKYFVAECVDLPVVTQGKTLDELEFDGPKTNCVDEIDIIQ